MSDVDPSEPDTERASGQQGRSSAGSSINKIRIERDQSLAGAAVELERSGFCTSSDIGR